MVKLNRIYTRTGDDGTTGLVDGSRVSKADPRLWAIGEVDEANSAIGVALAGDVGDLRDDLLRIQNDLFDLGADLATPLDLPGEALRVTPDQVAWLETGIDRMNERLPPLTSFILPGGAAAALHLARAIARRAERAAVAAAGHVAIAPEALRYLNRLSDWLFVATRHLNQSSGGDVMWRPGASRHA